jgi:hypothetical protein
VSEGTRGWQGTTGSNLVMVPGAGLATTPVCEWGGQPWTWTLQNGTNGAFFAM